VGDELFHADGRTDMTKVRVASQTPLQMLVPVYQINGVTTKDRYADTNHSPQTQNPLCEFLGFRYGVDEASVLLGHDAESIGTCFPTFRYHKVKQDWDFSTPEDETITLSRNIRKQIPSNIASCSKRTDTKSTLSPVHHSVPTNTEHLRGFTAPFTTEHLQDQHTITHT
jgi:hypothetical protein